MGCMAMRIVDVVLAIPDYPNLPPPEYGYVLLNGSCINHKEIKKACLAKIRQMFIGFRQTLYSKDEVSVHWILEILYSFALAQRSNAKDLIDLMWETNLAQACVRTLSSKNVQIKSSM